MKLLIVESPGKTKKLKEILGNNWQVMASVGHIRDLPTNSFGVEKSTFKPEYEISEDKKSVVENLKTAVGNCDEVYLATDPDREGEAIAWHLKEVLGLNNPKRVTYTSITQKDVLDSISRPRTIDMPLVYAQEARRVLDRLCGYMVSPVLNNVLAEKCSAGRVQSPAVSLVVKKEQAIRSFVSTTHYGIKASFEHNNSEFFATWDSKNFLEPGEEYILNQELAQSISQIKAFTVKNFDESEKKQAPPAPFTTSTLQQASSNSLKFTPKKTMQVAQKLYENGHITYMRTDSPNLSGEALSEIFSYCDSHSFPRVEKARTWKSKDNAQEAHEAIRPTHIEIEEIEGSSDEKALYSLIRNRVLASQLKEAVFSVRTLTLIGDFEGKEVLFEGKGRVLTFQGWKVIFDEDSALTDDEGNKEEENSIPALAVDTVLSASKSELQTKKTKPPTRYTQASLIRDLEKQGIGRPATYASIMDNILSKGYIKEEQSKLSSTSLGENLIENMQGYFSFLSLEFTKSMEDRLDEIAQGKHKYTDEVSHLYTILEREISNFRKGKGVLCPNCQSLNFRHIKGEKNGKAYDFFACQDCKENFDNLNGKPVKQERKQIPLTDYDCSKCSSKLKHIKGEKNGTEYDFFACSNEACGAKFDNIDGKPQERTPKDKGDVTQYKCKKCKKPLLKKPTKNGGFWFSCSGFPHCKEKHWANVKGEPKFY